jgi:hypothetical protein
MWELVKFIIGLMVVIFLLNIVSNDALFDSSKGIRPIFERLWNGVGDVRD